MKLKSIASSISAEDAVRELADIAKKLGVVCPADVNDIEVVAYPDDSSENLVLAYQRAKGLAVGICFALGGF